MKMWTFWTTDVEIVSPAPFSIFAEKKNCRKLKKNRVGGGVFLVLPLDPLMDYLNELFMY